MPFTILIFLFTLEISLEKKRNSDASGTDQRHNSTFRFIPSEMVKLIEDINSIPIALHTKTRLLKKVFRAFSAERLFPIYGRLLKDNLKPVVKEEFNEDIKSYESKEEDDIAKEDESQVTEIAGKKRSFGYFSVLNQLLEGHIMPFLSRGKKFVNYFT